MILEDDKFVIHGPQPAESLSDNTVGKEIFKKLLTNAATNDDVMIDVFTGRTLSYRSLLQKSCELAEALRARGYAINTVLSISSENNLEFYIPVLASLFIGCIMAPINHNYTRNEINHILNIGKPKIIFCSKDISQKFLHLKESLSFIEEIIIIDSNKSVPGTKTLEEFVQKSLNGNSVLPEKFQPIIGDATNMGAFILCSSGTTGLPKGVMLSHRNILARLLQSRDPSYSLQTKNVLGLMPFFHSYGLNVGLDVIANHGKLIVLKRFDEDKFLKSIQDYKISSLALAPPLAIFIEKSPKVFNYDLSCVEEVACGAAPLSKSTEFALKRRLKNLKLFRQGYGLTEATFAVTISSKENQKPGSCGKVGSFMSCKVIDPKTGKSLGPNQQGEMCCKGELIMMGYYRNEKATRETFTSDGWLRTGDLVYYDEEGHFYIVDRLKELIKYKGYQVAPAELEALLLNHPKVRDAAVVGLPDEQAGELPLAFVVKNEKQDITEADLQNYVKNMVSSQKWLRGGIIFVSEIPKNPSGKILRRELRNGLKNYQRTSKSKL